MNKKYYTPELSEFHVGFECEIRGNKNDEFAKAIVSLYSIYTMDASRPLTTLMAYPVDKTNNMIGIHVFESELDGFVRVKCLDEEDIIDCGWAEIENYGGNIKKFNIGRYYFWVEDEQMIISQGSPYYPCAVFIGDIKNKSELKQLMKMLGINGN